MMKKALLVLCAVLCAWGSHAQGIAQKEIEAFAAQTGAHATTDKATGSLSYLRFPKSKPFQLPGASTAARSLGFVRDNARLFGIRPALDEFSVKDEKVDSYGKKHVALQQTYRGVPVFDGILKFHFTGNMGLSGLNGNFISGIKINPVPRLNQADAERIALGYVGGKGERPLDQPLRAHKSTLYVFQKGLVQGYRGPAYLVYEVEVRSDAGIREFLYIEAHDGRLIEQFTGNHSIHRTLYEKYISPAYLTWNEGDALPGTLDVWQRSEVETSAFIYNLMKNAFGRTSFDGLDAPMITINNSPAINCPNANWNGISANYCTGTAADDVVAHEWGHAYTEYTSGLVYGWQSGALNEGYSDIWGETVDQLNNYMDQGEQTSQQRTGCNSSTRWQLGEKTTGFGGAIRDMWDPTCFGNPGKVSDPQYWCGNGDFGGVHLNSGVINHAYALLVDGGTYNGQTITGIGLTKAAHIFWRAQAEYMTRTTDFSAQADILEAAGEDLLGETLMQLSTDDNAAEESTEKISAADLVQLSKVIQAVELRLDNPCNFQKLLADAPPLCEGANPGLAIFNEDFEHGLGDFKTSFATSSSTWVARNWSVAAAPRNHGGSAAFAYDYPGGDCSGSSQEGVITLTSPVITIPEETAGNLHLVFDHYVATEAAADGGNVKYSINGGSWKLLPASAFTANPYNNVVLSYWSTSEAGINPLAGEPAFSGTDDGSVAGSWGQSQVDLTAVGLEAGDKIRFRWDFGTDQCSGYDGWYVDNVRVYSCQVTPAVHFALESQTMNEGEGTQGQGCLPYVEKKVRISIDKAPSAPVTVTLDTPGGTARSGVTGDYTISPAVVTLQSGALSRDITVRIYNDAYVEGAETILLSYKLDAHGGNAFSAETKQNFTLTIVDDDLTPGNYTEELLSSGFDTGQQGWGTINGGTSPNTWFLVAPFDQYLNQDGRPFFRVTGNDVIRPDHVSDEILLSPVINTQGKKNLVLTFSQTWLPYEDGVPETGMVDVWDGTEWHNLLTINEDSGVLGNLFTGTPDKRTIGIPDAYANAGMRIRFHFVANLTFHWAVDDVKLTASNSTQIRTAVNTGNGASEYLGPNETAVFYHPEDGTLIGRIRNLSAHDYGCTIMEIDRTGKDETGWVGSYHITRKTYKVTPEFNNPAGKYEITLYYKTSELPNFNGSAITSMGKSAGSIGAGNTAVSSFAEVQVSSAFDTDLAYTASFDSGFSGFGLSDAPPVGPLPVTWISFTAAHTAEGNILNWSTSGEAGSDYFVVQKSRDASSFEALGTVTAAGTVKTTSTYRFTDGQAAAGITYYRIKQVDRDARFRYSRIVKVEAGAGAVTFFPNPVQSTLKVQLPSSESRTAKVQVVDAGGRTHIARDHVKVENGGLSVDMEALPSGIYQIIVNVPEGRYSVPVVKL
ncbi:M4 family metallopeptidase [Dyadobacter sandarakinus]|uniref:M4 family metallopeptidase n=1 Tax=Dyadobacter sandarakinus TaxID=2747268 RepID=A0ABX7I4Y2_9BACT|nr:M4 family metallopeptidase [Dyadobacter sandarakinus]QRR01142.1 M4 family metallopeptidase [Dyadobacter sandarakinus]